MGRRIHPLRCTVILMASLLSLWIPSIRRIDGIPVHRHYVLVHGSGLGAWCWYKVQTLLQEAGNNVTSLDLTSAGLDPTDPNTVLTFEEYNKPLIHLLHSQPPNEKVVLVGHSAGGLSLSYAIHLFGPTKIEAAVFAGAIMLRSGITTTRDLETVFPDLGNYVNIVFGKGPDHSPTVTSFAFRPEFVRRLLYNESPEEDVVLSLSLMKSAPFQAMQARFNGTHCRAIDRVPRVYVKTKKDRVLKPAQQDAMIGKWPPRRVVSLDSDHSPFFSAPRRLVFDVLLKI